MSNNIDLAEKQYPANTLIFLEALVTEIQPLPMSNLLRAQLSKQFYFHVWFNDAEFILGSTQSATRCRICWKRAVFHTSGPP